MGSFPGMPSNKSRSSTMPPPTRCMSASRPGASPAASARATDCQRQRHGRRLRIAEWWRRIIPPTFRRQPSLRATANVAAGQSSDAAGRGTGLDGFNVATYTGGTVPGTMNLLTGFGKRSLRAWAILPSIPARRTPGFEFTITNFSKLLGANPAKGFVVMTQDGEVNVDYQQGRTCRHVPEHRGSDNPPEPTTWMVWAGLAGGMAWGYRRRSRRSPA